MDFKELNVTSNEETKIVNFNGKDIAVKQYLPLMDKYYLSQGIVNSCIEQDGRVINSFKKDLAYVYDIINSYTDLDLVVEETLEETAATYDAIMNGGLFSVIIEAIPQSEINIINTYIENGLLEVKQYANSPLSILDNVMTTLGAVMDQFSRLTPEQINELQAVAQELQKSSDEVREGNEKIEESK